MTSSPSVNPRGPSNGGRHLPYGGIASRACASVCEVAKRQILSLLGTLTSRGTGVKIYATSVSCWTWEGEEVMLHYPEDFNFRAAG